MGVASQYNLTPNDLLERFTEEQLTQLTDGSTSFNTAVIEKQIDGEERTFEGFAGVYYAVPVRNGSSAVPGIVREMLLDGVALRLLFRKPEFLNSGGDLAPLWDRKARELNAWKMALSDPSRKVQIPGGLELGSPTAVAGAAALAGEDAEYTAESMAGWR